MRTVAGLAACAWVVVAAALAARAEFAPALISVDVESGAILEARNIDSPRRPASLAKLMTVYLAFRALADGSISKDQVVTVSRAAATQPPVKIGLRAGERVSFGALLAATAVGSANDAAVAVAEALSETEAAFVTRMNAAAAEIGLVNTRYGAASGLPSPKARTTARDVALLARRILEDFPERAQLFGRREARIGDRRVGATNGLLGVYRGARGMKTGYTCAAGYSLTALAERDGRRILAVTLGAPSRVARNRAAMAQLDRAFDRPVDAASPTLAAAIRPSGAIEPPSAGVCGGAPARDTTLTGWAVFLGAYPGREAAETVLRRAAAQGGGGYIARRRIDRRWSALRHGFDREAAIRACLAIRRDGGYCLLLSPQARAQRARLWR